MLRLSLYLAIGLFMARVAFSQDAELHDGAAPSAANPHVTPGKVRWHADFAAACDAGRISRKPVLLFHLLGRLDQEYT
jgi:hypothetical protein